MAHAACLTLFFTNLCDCAHVVDPAGENGNQNFARAAVTLPPTGAPYREAEVILCQWAEEVAEYDRCQTVEVVEIYGGRKVEANVVVTLAVAGNRRSRICRWKLGQRGVSVAGAAASEVAMITGHPEVADVD